MPGSGIPRLIIEFVTNNRILLAGLLLLSAWVSGYAAGRPNVLLILSDDMGYSDLGCFGSEIATPRLDALAANGLRFTQFYNGARCCPTRASLLTGLYPHQAGMGFMVRDAKAGPGYAGDLSRNAVTIAEVLRAAGYQTGMVGKWHVSRSHTMADISNWPIQRGFGSFYGTIRGFGSFYDPETLTRQNTFITPENDPEYRSGSYYYTDAISDNAISFLRRNARQEAPFFLYVAYTAAHWPLQAPESEIEKYRGKYDAGYDAIRRSRLERLKQLGLTEAQWTPAPTIGNWEEQSNKAWEARNME
ncbi:MAG: sulfatase-like hydrolase/transferase, partial [Opitutaceae bacterium]|nr:sulfatase-like hydrolase/transferase [Opitutaceae bacterium]